MLRKLPLLALLAASACAHVEAVDRRLPVEAAVGQFDLRFAELDREAAGRVAAAIEHAGPRLAVWGALREPVTVIVEPSHAALESDVGRKGYDWLRAWARYREVWVQSPRTWGLWGAGQQSVDELLLHELTHCVMYQLGATEADWATKGIPLWFREGMASFTANQGYRRGTLEELADWVQHHPEDPLADAESLYQRKPELVYGAAHQAFTFLVQRYGIAKIRALLQAMHTGLSFDAAFQSAIGLNRRDFERDFLTYVRFRGFNGRPRS